VRLGIDVGSVRIGVAASDPEGRLAVPVTVLRRDRRGADLDAIAAIATEREAVEIIVGLPRSLSGGEGPAAVAARQYADRLTAKVGPIPVRLVDERLSTVEATRGLRAAGVDSRTGRESVDAAAAVVILQHALDSFRDSTQ
jgi:putative Holliday junction resolvase